MHTLKALLLILHFSQINGFSSGTRAFLSQATNGNIGPKTMHKARSDSLSKLLRRIIIEYFEDCGLGIIYDSSYEEIYPVNFRDYFYGLGITFNQESVDFFKSRQPNERKTNKCFNYIVFLGNIIAIKHIMAQNIESKIVIVSPETPWEIKDFLKSPISKMYKHLIIVTHSMSRRKEEGTYLLYTHKLYADGSGSTVPLLLASWINNNFTFDDINLFPDKLKRGFMGHRLLVSAVENPPFAIRRSKSIFTNDVSQWDGTEVRLLRLSASYLNLTVEFTEPLTPVSTLLSPIELVKNDVLQGLTSAGIGGIYYTSDVGSRFDATAPHAEDCAAFISLASTALPKYRAILGPFQLPVWIMLCISYFTLIIPLSFNSKYTILSLIKHPSGLNNMFWYVFSTYTNSFVVPNPLLEYGIAKNSITILLGIYWVFTIIITACYTGSIVAFITLPVFPSAIENAEDLYAYRYRIGTLDHDGWEEWFNINNTDDEFLHRLFRKIEYVPTLLEGVKNASEAYFWPYAFLASKTALDYVIQTDFAPTTSMKRTLMHVSEQCFVRYNVVQLFPAKSLYTKYMNDFIIRATETGLMDKIETDIDWEVQRIATINNKQAIKRLAYRRREIKLLGDNGRAGEFRCNHSSKRNLYISITKKMTQTAVIEDRVLMVEDTQGMFLILGSGVLVALAVLTLENITSFFKKRQLLKEQNEADDEAEEKSISDYWQQQDEYQTVSWLFREDAFPGIRQRFARGSV